jgi:hypothetical protein
MYSFRPAASLLPKEGLKEIENFFRPEAVVERDTAGLHPRN